MNEQECRELVKDRAVSYSDELWSITSHLPCECCGHWTTALEMHHRKFRSRGGGWTPSNVIGLCHLCHVGATQEMDWARQAGLNVHTFEDPAKVAVQLWYTDAPVCLDDAGGYDPCCDA